MYSRRSNGCHLFAMTLAEFPARFFSCTCWGVLYVRSHNSASCSLRSSPNLPTMCASILIRKSDFRQVGEMQPFLKQLNETQGFQQLSSGIRVYNSFLQREILVFGVFNSWLGDSPERCSVGAFKNPTPMSQKGCHFCLQDADVWHLMLAGEVHSSYIHTG